MLSTRALLLIIVTTISNHTIAETNENLEQAKNLYYSGDLKNSEIKLKSILNCCKGEEYYYLALIHESNKQFSESFKYYNLSAANGYQPAMMPLSRAYRLGIGVEEDLIKSIDWDRESKKIERDKKNKIVFIDTNERKINILEEWKKKANNGDINAHYRLAKFYDEGLLTNQDLDLAIKYYKKAYSLGNKEAKIMTGYFYCKGISVNPDKIKAKDLLPENQDLSTCIN